MCLNPNDVLIFLFPVFSTLFSCVVGAMCIYVYVRVYMCIYVFCIYLCVLCVRLSHVNIYGFYIHDRTHACTHTHAHTHTHTLSLSLSLSLSLTT